MYKLFNYEQKAHRHNPIVFTRVKWKEEKDKRSSWRRKGGKKKEKEREGRKEGKEGERERREQKKEKEKEQDNLF